MGVTFVARMGVACVARDGVTFASRSDVFSAFITFVEFVDCATALEDRSRLRLTKIGTNL